MVNPTPRVLTAEAIREKWDGLFKALNHDNDRVCAIVATSYVEHTFRALLRSRFVNCDTAKALLDPTQGALGLLHNATALAYSIGAISKGCRQTINQLGAVRNLFAHSLDDLHFSAPEVEKLCRELIVPLPRIAFAVGVDPNPSETDLAIRENPRNRFTTAANMVCMTLMLDSFDVKHAEKLVNYWDRQKPQDQ